MKIVLASGYFKSPHALALIVELRRMGFDVCMCLSVRSFQWKRILQYMRHFGFSFLWKKFTGRILGISAGVGEDDTFSIKEFLRERKISYPTLKHACKDLEIEYLDVHQLNDPHSLLKIKSHAPDLAIYSGGGILRKSFIQSFPRGVLNAHSGPLPFFRGMNVLEWSLWHGVRPAVTVHYIHSGIDTGDILLTENIPIDKGDSLTTLRAKAIRLGVEMILKVAGNLETFHQQRRAQKKSEGVQFFMMHPSLQRILESRLENGSQEWMEPHLFHSFRRVPFP